jgi:hemoglobin-like flavoprotein
MTPEQIELVESSIAALGGRLDETAAVFYERLFELDPALREMFPDDLAVQQRKFGVELAFIASSIRAHDRFVHAAGELGARHVGYGVRASHVRTARKALLDALRTIFGSGWSSSHERAWSLAYRLVSEAMMAGITAPPPR